MSFQDTAKAAIIAELQTAPEMALIEQFKTSVLTKIAEPAIDMQFVYVLPERLKDDRLAVLKLCAVVALGALPLDINNNSITVKTTDLLLF